MTDIQTSFANALATKFAKKIYEKKADKLIIGDKEYELVKADTGTQGKITFTYVNNEIFKIFMDTVMIYYRGIDTDWGLTFSGTNTGTSESLVGDAFPGVTKIVYDGMDVEDYSSGGFTHTFTSTGEHTVNFIGNATSIGESAFKGVTNLQKITFPETMGDIGLTAFNGCITLSSVEFPDTMGDIAVGAFNGCTSLTSISFGTVGDIAGSAFWNCPYVNSLTFEDECGEIGENSFGYCTGLNKVVFPETMGNIAAHAFWGDSNIRELTFHSPTPPTIGMTNFGDLTGVTVKVPTASLDAYKATANMPNPSTNTYIGI